MHGLPSTQCVTVESVRRERESMSDTEREFLTADQALAMLPEEGEYIHTFTPHLIGANWERQSVVDLINGAERRELAGPMATRMGHGLVVQSKAHGVLFVATRREGAIIHE